MHVLGCGNADLLSNILGSLHGMPVQYVYSILSKRGKLANAELLRTQP